MERAAYLALFRQRREEIAAAVAEGKPYLEVAAAFGITKARVSQIAQRMGVAPGGNRSRQR